MIILPSQCDVADRQSIPSSSPHPPPVENPRVGGYNPSLPILTTFCLFLLLSHCSCFTYFYRNHTRRLLELGGKVHVTIFSRGREYLGLDLSMWLSGSQFQWNARVYCESKWFVEVYLPLWACARENVVQYRSVCVENGHCIVLCVGENVVQYRSAGVGYY